MGQMTLFFFVPAYCFHTNILQTDEKHWSQDQEQKPF